jgi:hypothetical protein
MTDNSDIYTDKPDFIYLNNETYLVFPKPTHSPTNKKYPQQGIFHHKTYQTPSNADGTTEIWDFLPKKDGLPPE